MIENEEITNTGDMREGGGTRSIMMNIWDGFILQMEDSVAFLRTFARRLSN